MASVANWKKEVATATEAALKRMFDEAWDSLSPEEREEIVAEREQWLGNLSYANRRRHLVHMQALPQDTEIVRRMSPEEKLAVMHALIRQAWELKAVVIRSREPELSEAEVTARAWEMVAGD